MAVAIQLEIRPAGGGLPPLGSRPLPIMDGERRTFGELLRHYRRLKYKNLERLAEKLDTSKDVLSNYENDKVRPSHEILLRLIDELQMPPLPLLRALGYPLNGDDVDWEARLMEDSRLDDETRQALAKVIRRIVGPVT